MRLRIGAVLGALFLLGAVAGVARATVTFGAAVFGPVSGAPFAAAGLISLGPVGSGQALALTRATDANSARLRQARLDGTHFRTLRLAWAVAGAIESECLDDVAVTSYVVGAPPPAGGPPAEHMTLAYAEATRTFGPAACRRHAPPPPVVVRLFTVAGGGLRAGVDCLAAGCAGTLRIFCARLGCPSAGLDLGAFKLGPGAARVLAVGVPEKVGGRHPKLTVVLRPGAAGARRVLRVVVDPPVPGPRRATLVAGAPSASGDPTPPTSIVLGGPPPGGGTPGAGAGGAGTGSAGPGGGPGGGAGGGGTTTPPPDGGSGGGGGASGGGPIDTTLALTCDGTPDSFRAVHGVLGPSLAGQPIEIDYVPVDPNADTVIHTIMTGAGGRYADAAGTPFVEAIAFYVGDDDHLSSSAFCPS
ncbi:MAG: hypothetical protein LC720_00780 [Actinobacteria bacterium]|nr:hypothetical protein [Actinomycetota bacterium]